MSDYAIPEAEPGAGDERAQVRDTAAPHPAPVSPSSAPATSPLSGEEAEDLEASRAAAASLRTLLGTAVTRRSVDEVADLVTLLRGTGQVPDAADQALRAAAVSRPIEDVISLAVLLSREDEAQRGSSEAQQESESQPHPRPESETQPQIEAESAEPGRAHRAKPERRSASRVSLRRADHPPREASEADAEGSVAGRVMRWPVAVTLAVSALLYLPRHPSRFLAPTSLPAWLTLGLAGMCLTLAVLMTVRDRAWVWSATTVTGIGLVAIHALAAVMNVNLLGSTAGGLLPWPTGVSMLAAGLTAVLSVMALLYRSDRAQPTPGLPVLDLPGTAPNPLHTPPAPTTDLARETEATAP